MRRLITMTLLSAVAHVAPLSAQTVDELVAAGRYEDAAAALSNAGPEEAQAGAMAIYQHAYTNSFRTGAWADAIRGFSAARQVPNLNERQRQQFDFWHGSALVNSVRADSIQPPALTDEQKVEVLYQAYDLLQEGRDYAAGINQLGISVSVMRWIDQLLDGGR